MWIINADDFGHSPEVNAGVMHCFEKGLCNSASIMPNMPGFEEACQLGREHGLEDRIGLHLVLTEGEPLTEAMRSSRLFCTDGRFSLSRSRRVFWLSRADKIALADEIRAQVAKCREHGLPLTHLDSHNHAHEEWWIGAVVIALAKELAIPRVRIALTFTEPLKWARGLYRWGYNRRLRKAGLARSQLFGGPGNYLAVPNREAILRNMDCEVMLHPLTTAGGLVVDSVSGDLPDEVIPTLTLRSEGEGRSVVWSSVRDEMGHHA